MDGNRTYEEITREAIARALGHGPRSPGWFASCIASDDIPTVTASWWEPLEPGSLAGRRVEAKIKLEGLYHALDALEQRIARLERER